MGVEAGRALGREDPLGAHGVAGLGVREGVGDHVQDPAGNRVVRHDRGFGQGRERAEAAAHADEAGALAGRFLVVCDVRGDLVDGLLDVTVVEELLRAGAGLLGRTVLPVAALPVAVEFGAQLGGAAFRPAGQESGGAGGRYGRRCREEEQGGGPGEDPGNGETEQ
ncbi:hypothetical protein [Nocardiopsis salina]|uniref:hypothetical protein n=1 Tax=Nocardiopsis salina TaxID=245836 RepID=UPI001EF9E0EC|nr:hypothetical protein [Nocardiopsis salina]